MYPEQGYALQIVYAILILVLLTKQKIEPYFDKNDLSLIWPILIYTTTIIAFTAIHRGDSPFHLSIQHWVISIVIYKGLINVKIETKLLAIYIGITAFIYGAISFYEINFLKIGRSNGGINAINYGNAATLFGSLALTFSIVNNKWKIRYRALLCLSSICAYYASITSLTRGAWLSVPPVIFLILVLLATNLKRISATKFTMIFLGMIAIIFALYSYSTPLKTRVDIAYNQATAYMSDGKLSSVGARLEMWRLAWLSFLENPISGHSRESLPTTHSAIVEAGKIKLEVLRFTHSHSDYFDHLAYTGLAGIITFILLHLAMATIFFRSMDKSMEPDIPTLGLVLVASFSIFSLTQSFHHHASGVGLFSFLMAVLASQIKSRSRW